MWVRVPPSAPMFSTVSRNRALANCTQQGDQLWPSSDRASAWAAQYRARAGETAVRDKPAGTGRHSRCRARTTSCARVEQPVSRSATRPSLADSILESSTIQSWPLGDDSSSRSIRIAPTPGSASRASVGSLKDGPDRIDGDGRIARCNLRRRQSCSQVVEDDSDHRVPATQACP